MKCSAKDSVGGHKGRGGGVTSRLWVIFKAVRLIVTHQLRQEMFNEICDPHSGIVKTRVKSSVSSPNWPNMSSCIKETVSVPYL